MRLPVQLQRAMAAEAEAAREARAKVISRRHLFLIIQIKINVSPREIDFSTFLIHR